MNIIEFLTARLDEESHAAWRLRTIADRSQSQESTTVAERLAAPFVDPSRILEDNAFKRRIVGDYAETLRFVEERAARDESVDEYEAWLAATRQAVHLLAYFCYRDHPDFRKKWTPGREED